MKVILLEDIKKLGKKHDQIEVKDGYGNFLITSGKAVLASNKAQSIVNKQKADAKAKHDLEVAKATKVKEQIEKITLVFSLKTNNGQAFGSISNKQVLDELESKHGLKIDKHMLVGQANSYTLGGYRIGIKLHKEVIAYLTIRVTGE